MLDDIQARIDYYEQLEQTAQQTDAYIAQLAETLSRLSAEIEAMTVTVEALKKTLNRERLVDIDGTIVRETDETNS